MAKKKISISVETADLIREKFRRDFHEIQYQIRQNKKKIKNLADEQKKLKLLGKGLFNTLRLIKEETNIRGGN